MKGLLGKHFWEASIQFDYVDSIPTTKTGKYKFVINESQKA